MVPAGVFAFVVMVIGLLSAAALAGHKSGCVQQASDDGEGHDRG